MLRQVGSATGIMALLAVLFHAEFSSERGRSSKEQATISQAANKAEHHSQKGARSAAEEKTSGESAERSRPEDTVEGPWLPIRRFFGTSGGSASTSNAACGIDFAIPASRVLSADSSLKPCQVRTYLGLPPADRRRYPVIIATVSDPVHSHLAIYTDHEIEGILAGLSTAGWDFAGQWLPWSDSFLGAHDTVADRPESRALLRSQEDIPGVLIFRGGVPGPCSTPWTNIGHISWPVFCQDTLFLLVVPETPAAGINPSSFHTAIRMAVALSGKQLREPEISSPGYSIALLAPTFTGSFFSLARLIKDLPSDVASLLSKNVYSGTASGFQYAEAFQDSTCFKFLGNSASSADFYFAFTKLLERYKLRKSDVAWVIEDGTGFSRSASQTPWEMPKLPDDVNDLPVGKLKRPDKTQRSCAPNNNQNEKNSKPQLMLPQTRTPTPGSDIPELDIYRYPREISHLRNAYREEETADSGNPGQRLASRVLLSLKDPNAGEDAVPVFDTSHTPVAQLAVIDSIVQDLRDRQKRLVVVTATNPLDLLFLTQVIRKGSAGTRTVVESPDTVFLPAAAQNSLAGALLLSSYPLTLAGQDWRHVTLARPPAKDFRSFTSPLAEGVFQAVLHLLSGETKKFDTTFDPQFQPEFRPAVWLLELTRNGVWPLQVFDESPKKTFDWYPEKPEATYTARLAPIRLSLPWILTTAVSVLFAIFFFGTVLWNSIRARKNHFLRFTSVQDAKGWSLVALSGLTLSVNSVILLLLVPYFCLAQASSSTSLASLTVVAGLIVCGAPIAASLWLLGVLTKRVFSRSEEKRTSLWFSQTSLLSLWALSVGLWMTACYPSDWSGVFFCFRAIAIFSGASPMLPPLLFACGFFVQFLILCQAFEQACCANKPQLHLEQFNLLPLAHRYDKVEEIWSNTATNAGTNSVKVLSVVALAFLPIAIYSSRWFAAFEMRSFNVLISVALSALLLWLVLHSIRLYRAWRYLSDFLSMLGSMRIQRSFRRVTEDWPKRLAWAPPSRDTLALSCEQTIEAVHNWSLAEDSTKREKQYEDLRGAFEEMVHARMGISRSQSASSKAVSTSQIVLAQMVGGAATPVSQAELARTTSADVFSTLQVEHTELTFQKKSAALCQDVLVHELWPFWKESISNEDPGVRPSVIENNSELLPKEERKLKAIFYGSNFVALHIAAYVVYAVRQVHRTAKSLYFGIIFIVLILLSYHPQDPRLVAGFVSLFFVAMAALVFYVLSGMQRDKVLSFLSKTDPGELNLEFWTKIIALGGIPFIGVVSHLFPSVSSFLFDWVSPGIKAME